MKLEFIYFGIFFKTVFQFFIFAFIPTKSILYWQKERTMTTRWNHAKKILVRVANELVLNFRNELFFVLFLNRSQLVRYSKWERRQLGTGDTGICSHNQSESLGSNFANRSAIRIPRVPRDQRWGSRRKPSFWSRTQSHGWSPQSPRRRRQFWSHFFHCCRHCW